MACTNTWWLAGIAIGIAIAIATIGFNSCCSFSWSWSFEVAAEYPPAFAFAFDSDSDSDSDPDTVRDPAGVGSVDADAADDAVSAADDAADDAAAATADSGPVASNVGGIGAIVTATTPGGHHLVAVVQIQDTDPGGPRNHQRLLVAAPLRSLLSLSLPPPPPARTRCCSRCSCSGSC